MADYYIKSRTNYFQVNNAELFEKWINQFDDDIECIKFEGDSNYDPARTSGSYVLLTEEHWPLELPEVVDDDAELETAFIESAEDFNFFEVLLTEHVKPGEVVIVMKIGWEKLRFLVGEGWALRLVHGVIEREFVSIENVQEMAGRRWPDARISEAAY